MSNLFSGIYQGKKVLITGDTGFKGSWLGLWLTQLGAEVTGFALEPPSQPSMFTVSGLEKHIRHIHGDIRDYGRLLKTIEDIKPEIVFHLAAQSLVRQSYWEPRLTYETNVMGTLNLFEALRENENTRVIVNITSDKCYQNREWVYGYREIDPMGGYDPYSSSKGCAELVTASYRNSFFNPNEYGKTHKTALASARAGNVIGGGDWAEDRLIPDCFRSLSKDEPIYIRNPYAVRPWQHVLEPIAGYLWLGALLWQDGISYSEPWNFGPYDEDILPVRDVVKTIINIWGKGNMEIQASSKMHEAGLLKLDISKARTHLHWKPVFKILQALEQTTSWYREYYSNNKNMFQYSLDQIENYIQQARNLCVMWCCETL